MGTRLPRRAQRPRLHFEFCILHSSFCISPLPPAENQPEFVRKSLFGNYEGRCGEGFWLWPRRPWRRAAPRSGLSGTSQRRPRIKDPPPGGFSGKRPSGFVAPRSQTAGGYAPSSRLPSGLLPEDRPPANFKTGSYTVPVLRPVEGQTPAGHRCQTDSLHSGSSPVILAPNLAINGPSQENSRGPSGSQKTPLQNRAGLALCQYDETAKNTSKRESDFGRRNIGTGGCSRQPCGIKY